MDDTTVRNHDASAKTKMKFYADRRSSHHQLRLGDQVLVPATKKDKLTPNFKPTPYTVDRMKGTMITARHEHHTVTRNSSLFKPCPNVNLAHALSSSDEEEEEEVMTPISTNHLPDRQTSPDQVPDYPTEEAAGPEETVSEPRRSTRSRYLPVRYRFLSLKREERI